MRLRATAAAAGVLAAVSLGGCASSHPFDVRALSAQGDVATTADTVDVGLPPRLDHSGSPVRLRSIVLVGEPAAVRLVSVTAYRTFPDLGLEQGNLLQRCRKQDPPHPLSDVRIASHAGWHWQVVLAFRFAKPGRYHLGRIRLSYSVGGQRGWQYEGLGTTVIVTAAGPGARPGFDGCL